MGKSQGQVFLNYIFPDRYKVIKKQCEWERKLPGGTNAQQTKKFAQGREKKIF